jgi:hypothetical protein
MLQNMHLLMALPSDRGPVTVTAKKAEHLPIEGLRVYLPSGHFNRLDMIAYWLKRLTADPISWLRPSETRWQLELDGAKAHFEHEIAKSYPYTSEVSWPSWLTGTLSLTPEFESGADFKPRLVFYVNELVVAKAKNPSSAELNQAVVVNQYIQYIEGGYHVSSDQFNISNVSGQIGAIGTNNNASGTSFSQSLTEAAAQIDAVQLAAELALLKAELKKLATDVEHEFSVANVAAAEIAAKKGDAEGSIKYLKAAGKWALDTATKIGTQVAVKAIESAISAP